MKTILSLLLTVTSTVTFAQNTTVLDQNNVSAVLQTNGLFFNNQADGAPGYTVPKDSMASVIYSSAFWFGGTDSNGGLHLAGTKYAYNDDVFCGPISSDYTDTDYLDLYEDKFWKITKSEINDHYYHYQQASYVMPSVIAEWPANGQSSIGVSNDMAPYVDMNSNGFYDPENGDYPNIRGDEAVYIIMNDAAGIHAETGGDPLGMEFHYMFYQFSSSDYINNTTFINLKVINRSVNTYSNFKVAYFADHDIGGYSDDFVGCSPSENLMIGYNGDQNDIQFGINPPAVGVKFLNHSLDVFTYFSGGGVSPQTEPNTAAEYYGFMNAMWGISGLPFTYGGSGINGSINARYMFPGNSDPLFSGTGGQSVPGWSEVSENNYPGNRSMVGVTGGVTITPNESICYDYAVLYNRSGTTNIENSDGLTGLSTQVQAFYDAEVNWGCDNVVLNTVNNSEIDFEMYPNPSNGELNLSSNSIFDVTIYSINGEVVYSNSGVNSTLKLNLDVSNGIYFVKVTQDNSTFTQKLIIK
jgi:hypothetical protein